MQKIFITGYLILVLLAVGIHFGLLDMSLAVIKGYDLRLTEQRYSNLESVNMVDYTDFNGRQTFYEDAFFGWKKDYPSRLLGDIEEIVRKRELIKKIDADKLEFYSNKFRIKVCIQDYQLEVKDTTLFSKMVNLSMYGYLELYEADGDSLIYAPVGHKFKITDKFYYQGIVSNAFIDNKTNEHWLSQMADWIPSFVALFQDEASREYYERRLLYSYGHRRNQYATTIPDTSHVSPTIQLNQLTN